MLNVFFFSVLFFYSEIFKEIGTDALLYPSGGKLGLAPISGRSQEEERGVMM